MLDVEAPPPPTVDVPQTPQRRGDSVDNSLADIGRIHFSILKRLDRGSLLSEGSLQFIAMEVANKYPEVFLSDPSMINLCPSFVEGAVRSLMEREPDRVFAYIRLFVNQPWAKDFLLTAMQHNFIHLQHRNGMGIFDHVEHFADQPWAEEILLAAMENNGAWGAFKNAQKLMGLPFGEKILRAAAQRDTWAMFHFVERYVDAPFARELLLSLVSKPFIAEAAEGRTLGGSTIMITIAGTGRQIRLSDFKRFARVPFARDILKTLADTNPQLVKIGPDTFKDFPGSQEIFEQLNIGVDLSPLAHAA